MSPMSEAGISRPMMDQRPCRPSAASRALMRPPLDSDGPRPRATDVMLYRPDGGGSVARIEGVENGQVLLHDGDEQVVQDADTLLADQPDLDRVNAIGVRDDLVAERVDDGV